MKSQNGTLEPFKVNTRIILIGLWVTLMLLYIYCDIYSFHRTGYIDEMIAGRIGPFAASQGLLAAFGVLMIIPILMIPACLFLKAGTTKSINVVVGILYTLVNLGNLVGETWAYYWIFGILEIAVTIGIIAAAIKWPEEKHQ